MKLRQFISKYSPKIFKKWIGYHYYLTHYKFRTNISYINLFFNKSLRYDYFKIKKKEMPMPHYVHFEPTTRCNMSCGYCTRSTIGDENLKTDIDLNIVHELLNSNKNLIELHIQGLGEPLMAKNINEIVHLIKQKNVLVSTFSNGTTLRKNASHRKILLENFNNVTISIDTLDPELANKIREGGNIDDILEGIKILIKEKEQNKSKLNISVNIVVTEQNINSIEYMLQTLQKIGVNNFGFNELENLKSSNDDDWHIYHNQALNARNNRTILLNKLETMDLTNIKIYNSNLSHSTPQKGICNWGFYRIFVTANGFVTPCCKRMEDNHKIIKDPINKNFYSQWNSKEMVDFRLTHIGNKPNPICDYCPN